MSVYDPDAANLSAWGELVEKQSKGLKPDDFTWHTPEGIPLKTNGAVLRSEPRV